MRTSRTSRRLWTMIATVAAAAALVGCAGPDQPDPSAPAPPASPAPAAAPPGGTVSVPRVPPGHELEAFRYALSQRNMTVGANDAETSGYARTICAQFDSGVPLPTVVGDVAAGTGFTPTDTGFVIGAAAATHCPQHLQRLTSGG